MSTTVLDALQNAKINFENTERFIPNLGKHGLYQIAKSQLDNALESIDNGKSLNDIIQDNIGEEVKIK